jgi:hypothetical protein
VRIDDQPLCDPLLATSFLRAEASPAFSPMAYLQERCATGHGVPGVSRDESPGKIGR